MKYFKTTRKNILLYFIALFLITGTAHAQNAITSGNLIFVDGKLMDSSGTTTLSFESEIQKLLNDVNSVFNSVFINVQVATKPTFPKMVGYQNKVATSTDQFKIVLTYSQANEYQMKLDGGSWSGWKSLSEHQTNGYITVSGVNSIGIHTVYVQLRNHPYGKIAQAKMAFFRK